MLSLQDMKEMACHEQKLAWDSACAGPATAVMA